MYSEKVIVQNLVGLRARVATIFLQVANGFSSDISISVVYDRTKANGRSLLGILSLKITGGSEIEIIAISSTNDAEAEKTAVKELVALINSNFTDY